MYVSDAQLVLRFCRAGLMAIKPSLAVTRGGAGGGEYPALLHPFIRSFTHSTKITEAYHEPGPVLKSCVRSPSPPSYKIGVTSRN